MKTIVHVIDSLGVGGAEVLLTNTIPLLKGYNNIICYLHKPDDLSSRLEEYPVHYLGFEKKTDFFKAVRKLRSIIVSSKASILHAHLLWSTWIARAASLPDVKLIFTIHNLLSRDAFEVNKASLVVEKLTYSKKQIAIGVSKEVLKDFDRTVGLKGPNFTLYNFIDDKFFEIRHLPKTNLNGVFKLVAVGNLRRQKNYKKVLEAFTYLTKYDISLDIYGVGELEEELSEFIKKHSLKVSLKGKTKDIINVLKQYDSYIMCSLYEGFSVALVEAMAIGMPVIVSGIDVLKEAVEDRGVYFDPNSPKDIANKILNVYNNWNEFRELSSGNSAFIKQKASKEQYLKNLLHIYCTS